MTRIIIIATLLVILWSLGTALFHMSSKKGDPRKMARALTIRIALSAGLFLFILLAYALGWIDPPDTSFLQH